MSRYNARPMDWRLNQAVEDQMNHEKVGEGSQRFVLMT